MNSAGLAGSIGKGYLLPDDVVGGDQQIYRMNEANFVEDSRMGRHIAIDVQLIGPKKKAQFSDEAMDILAPGVKGPAQPQSSVNGNDGFILVAQRGIP